MMQTKKTKNRAAILFSCLLGASLCVQGMEEVFIAPREIFLDGGSLKNNVNKLQIPFIGAYATPYRMAQPLFEIQSEAILDAMPSSVREHIASLYALKGSLEAIDASLHQALSRGELYTAVVFWKGLVPPPQEYNVVFHSRIAHWRKSGTQTFNVRMQAGILQPQGVKPASHASIPFNTLGALGVSLHDIDNYSPDNGKFAIIPGRAVATFWIIGEFEKKVTVSYNIFLADQEVQKRFEAIEDTNWEQQAIDEKVQAVMSTCEQVTKRLDGQGKQADSSALYEALELLRKVEARSHFYRQPVPLAAAPAPAQKVASPAEELKALHEQLSQLVSNL